MPDLLYFWEVVGRTHSSLSSLLGILEEKVS